MKTLIITLAAAGAVIAGYFGLRYCTHWDIGFTLVNKYVRDLVENLLHTETTAAHEVEPDPATTTEPAA